jgi:hypothetical protein
VAMVAAMSRTGAAFLPQITLLVAASMVAACGNDPVDGSDGSDGTFTEPYRNFCVASFTDDYDVVDVFGDVDFTARRGAAYLVQDFVGEDGVRLLYLTDTGPEDFDVPVGGASDASVDVNCERDAVRTMVAAFTDVSVYEDEALESKLCDLDADSIRPAASGPSGYTLVSDFSLSGPATYEVFLNAFADECGGAERGYVRVPATSVHGRTTWLVPIRTFLGPATDR